MAYSDKVMDHYNNPRNVGKWEPADNIGTGMVGAPGDKVGNMAKNATDVGNKL